MYKEFKPYLDSAFDELLLAIEKGGPQARNNTEVNFKIISFTHFLIDLDERRKRDDLKISSELEEHLNGMRFINNKLKHDGNLVVITAHAVYPLCGTHTCGGSLNSGSCYHDPVWTKLENRRMQNAPQYECYLKHLRFKPVRDTINEIMRMLETEL